MINLLEYNSLDEVKPKEGQVVQVFRENDEKEKSAGITRTAQYFFMAALSTIPEAHYFMHLQGRWMIKGVTHWKPIED